MIISNNFFFKKIKNKSLVNVLYHQVSDNPSEFHLINDLNVRIDNFYNQLLFFKKNFNIISPHQLLKKNYDTPALLITFDDGEKSFFSNVVEILNDLDLPCIHFLNMEPIIGGINFNGLVGYLLQKDKKFSEFYNYENILLEDITKKKVFDYLDRNDTTIILNNAREFHGQWASSEDLIKLSNNKLIFYGNHLFNHFNATKLSNYDLSFQYNENFKYLKTYKNFINMFSYPYGQPNLHYNNITNNFIKNLGASSIFSANPLNYSCENDHTLLHRLPMHESVNEEWKIREHIAKPKIRSILKNL